MVLLRIGWYGVQHHPMPEVMRALSDTMGNAMTFDDRLLARAEAAVRRSGTQRPAQGGPGAGVQRKSAVLELLQG